MACLPQTQTVLGQVFPFAFCLFPERKKAKGKTLSFVLSFSTLSFTKFKFAKFAPKFFMLFN